MTHDRELRPLARYSLSSLDFNYNFFFFFFFAKKVLVISFFFLE